MGIGLCKGMNLLEKRESKSMSKLSVADLQFEYPDGSKLSFRNFAADQGEKLLILGNSGSGKTTLLHLLAGLLSPTKGEIFYGDQAFSKLAAWEKDQFRGLHIGMIFQKHFFISGITVLENLRAARKFAGNNPDDTYIRRILERLGIEELASKKPESLSEGEQQRFSIARALANKPTWVLADEPTSSLDDVNCMAFTRLISADLADNATGWIIATHDARLKDHFQTIYQI